MDTLEYILPPIALALFAGYSVVWAYLLYFHPLSLNLGIKIAIRRRWGRQVVQANEAIVAVQTLRNSINAAAVFASASLVVAFFAFQQVDCLCLAGGVVC